MDRTEEGVKKFRVYLEAREQGALSFTVASYVVTAADQRAALCLAIGEAHREKLETRSPLRVTEVASSTRTTL